jgi:hypothetical protein
MGEVAAKPPPDPQDQLRDALGRVLSAVEGGTEVAQAAITARGDLLELMAWERRLAEGLGDLRAAALMLVASGQSAAAPTAEAPRKHRHRARPQRSRGALRPVPGVSSTAAKGAAAVAAAVVISTGGLVAGMHEEAAVRPAAAAPAWHVALHRMVPDAPVTRPRSSPSPRLSAAAAAPAPVPSVTPSLPASVPPPAPSPSVTVTATAAPALDVQQVLVHVTSALGSPVLALPSGL